VWVRGILTAMSWITDNSVKPFSPSELDAALTWLSLAEHKQAVETLIAQLHASMRQRGTPVTE
jgi:hypothetical protein